MISYFTGTYGAHCGSDSRGS